MHKKSAKYLAIVGCIVIICIIAYLDFSNWSNVLDKVNNFYGFEYAMANLEERDNDTLEELGFSPEEIEIISRYIKGVNLGLEYEVIPMHLIEPLVDETYFLENKYTSLYDQKMSLIASDTLQDYYYVYNLKLEVKRPFLLSRKKIELFNNINISPYRSLVIVSYIDKDENTIVRYSSFSDVINKNSKNILPSNTVSFNTRITYNNKKYILNNIEIIDIRNINRKHHAEYSLVSKSRFASYYVRGLYDL